MGKLIISQDGSHTVHSDKFGVSYHSKYGSIQETETVFIEAGLQYHIEKGLTHLSILEMGFGTGLNALMTFLKADQKISIDYHTIEAYPLDESQFVQLNFPEVLHLDNIQKDAFIAMHTCGSKKTVRLSDFFSFTKYIQRIEGFESPTQFDVIYYDAFAPTSQEELWTPEMMAKMYALCAPGAVLVTYCAKGSFKRALKSAGFTVEALDGPIGKREMTRAHKDS